METGTPEQNNPASTEIAGDDANIALPHSVRTQTNDGGAPHAVQDTPGEIRSFTEPSIEGRHAQHRPAVEPLADGSFSSVGPDSAVFNRFDQPTLVGLLIFCSLCLIGWSTWQWLTLRSRTIDIDQGRRTQLRFEVDLNLAPAAEFANLPGVGPKLAEEIVAFRKQNGRFNRFEDLLNVSGIGEAKFKAILPFLRPLAPAQTPPEVR